MTDHEAFEKLKQGDRDAMDWVYRTFRDAIARYFMKHAHIDENAAVDLAIDSVVRLGELVEAGKIKTLTASLKTLLIGIGKIIRLNALRLEKREKAIDWDDYLIFMQKWVGEHDNPLEIDELEEWIVKLKPLVENMKEPCRTVLLQRYWHKKRFKEIADMLGITEVACRMKERFCRQKLGGLL